MSSKLRPVNAIVERSWPANGDVPRADENRQDVHLIDLIRSDRV